MKIETEHNEGSHLTIDAFGCPKNLLKSESAIKSFLLSFPKKLGMIRISEPKVLTYNHPDTKESGVTGFVIIADSHISIHTYPEKNYFACDIFSCKEFDYNKAALEIEETFKAKRLTKQIIRRGHSETYDEEEVKKIKGIDITKTKTTKGLLSQFENCGLQATKLHQAYEIIKRMKKDNATIFLTFTSNMVSSGMRELFAHLCEKKFVDVIITGVGSLEEDLIKTKKDFLLGEFSMNDVELHQKGINRIGNILVPNDRYEMLEDLLIPFFDKIRKDKRFQNKMISPNEVIFELGKTVKDKNSILYQATKNNIPIFCPAITDGAFGLQIFFYKQKYPKFGIDTTGDMKELANITLNSEKTGGILLGGGFAKHHAIGVNILREGMDYAVYMTTATEYDGSLSGAKSNEAVSWSKIKERANSVSVQGDVSILFPLVMSSILK